MRIRKEWIQQLMGAAGGLKGDGMLRKLYANAVAKKTTIFAAVFAVTCILLGTRMTAMNGEEALVAAAAANFQTGQATVRMNEEDSAPTLRPVMFSEEETPPAAALPPYTKESGSAFPFSGEYPSVTADPLPVKPQLHTKIAVADGFVYTDQIPLSRELQEYTYTRCVELGLEYELVLALMWRESRFQVSAVNINTNGTRDSGIMQINDVNRGWLREEHGIVDLMDPVQNIDAGTIMLSKFVNKYGVHDALMAYQYGESGMRAKISQGIVTNDKITLLINKRDDFRDMLQNTQT